MRQFNVVTTFANRDRRSNACTVQVTGSTGQDNTQPLRGILCVVVCGGGKGWGIVPPLFRTFWLRQKNPNCGLLLGIRQEEAPKGFELVGGGKGKPLGKNPAGKTPVGSRVGFPCAA